MAAVDTIQYLVPREAARSPMHKQDPRKVPNIMPFLYRFIFLPAVPFHRRKEDTLPLSRRNILAALKYSNCPPPCLEGPVSCQTFHLGAPTLRLNPFIRKLITGHSWVNWKCFHCQGELIGRMFSKV
uniref:Uncharacterized protein n=1 Tax=Lygus hesperus TaxID=30085 RepID=A0A146LU24_LYGHE